MAKVATPRWGWALTGSGHFFRECLVAIRTLENVDLFVSKAASEVFRMYKQDLALPTSARIFRDTTASSPPVGYFYYWRLPYAGARTGDVEYGSKMRLRNFRQSCDECLRAGRQVSRPGDRFCLRYGTGTRNRGAEKHGQGLSASHRPREYLPTEILRCNRGSRVARRTRTGIGAP